MKKIHIVIGAVLFSTSANLALADPPQPPPVFLTLNSPCNAVDDDYHGEIALQTMVLLSEIETGKISHATLDGEESFYRTYEAYQAACQATEQAYEAGALQPGSDMNTLGAQLQQAVQNFRYVASVYPQFTSSRPDVDGMIQQHIRDAYGTFVAQMRNGHKYLQSVDELRSEVGMYLTQIAQTGVDCSVLAKTGGDFNSCWQNLVNTTGGFAPIFANEISTGISSSSANGDGYDWAISSRDGNIAWIGQLQAASAWYKYYVQQVASPMLDQLKSQADWYNWAQSYTWWQGYTEYLYAQQIPFLAPVYMALANYYWGYYGYYLSVFNDITQNKIPSLQGYMNGLMSDAYTFDSQAQQSSDWVKYLNMTYIPTVKNQLISARVK